MTFEAKATIAALTVAFLAGVYLIQARRLPPLPEILAFEAAAIPVVVEVNGRIQKVCIAKHSIVHVGDSLIQLDTRDLLHKKRVTESRIHFFEFDLQEGRAELALLYRELERIQFDLNALTITSATEGKIVSLEDIHSGEMLRAGTAVGVIAK